MDAKNGKNVLEKRDKELKEVKREKEELMKELKDFRIQMQRNVLDAKAEAKLAIKVNDELLVKLKKETREAREEAAKAVEERNEELRRRTRENANRKSVTRRGTTLDAALVKRQQTHIQDLEAQLAKLEESKLAESQKRESLQAKADDLQTQVVRLQEVHSADYTLPPISLHRSTMSTLLSPAPLAGDSPAPPGRRSKTGTPSMRAADVTPSMERGAGDTTSESRSRFTDSLPFRLEDDDDDEVEDALQDSPLCESEEQDDEQDAPVSAPKRRRKSKAARAKSSMPTKRGRRKTTTAPKPRSTVRRKRHTIEVEEYAESGTETGDISPKNVAQHVDDDSTHPSQKRIVRKGRPKAKRQKVAPEPTPEPQTQSASPATVVQRRAGGRALRSRRPVSYDYDKNDRDIVGKMPGYVVDHGALRPKRVSNPRHSIAKSLDFDLAADTSGAILAANIIRQSAQKRRAKQVQKKSGRRERGG
ncbi:unnamed protein product [Chondrus crispus]|uniref:Uncharacterized protein n=1 Tax=Chondrus crispus TaxID=2769 RepID=R7QKA6_CHOCR|nr:unnamed protein product [Chondrus crispus]CDF38203.1 unnamed protein product [Chondrus crispus]|eukprot:XP_005718088.1 unnamed protein product [Chondrus crispus]